MGYQTTANSLNSFVIGTYNVGAYSTGTGPLAGETNWVNTDPLFEIGNGTSSTPSDALVVYKNGTSAFQGTITAKAGVLTTAASVAQTDIPMFQP